jgi:hypothetical protein
VSSFSLALQPVSFPAAATAAPNNLSVITPIAPHLSLVVPAAAPAHDRGRPHGLSLVVSRDHHNVRGTCALCWAGPEPMAGSVRPIGAPAASQPICSRCLVTLEMLATLFDAELRLHVETQA